VRLAASQSRVTIAFMAEAKTKPTQDSVDGFIAAVDHPGKQADAKVLDALFRRVTGEEPRMWGPSIIGYGQYHYVYESGREGDMCRVGFSPRKAKHSLYITCECGGVEGARLEALLPKLGKYAQGQGGCMYVNKLADIDLAVLEEMVAISWKASFENWPQ
jgi:Domain of unknown function (DU1801)